GLYIWLQIRVNAPHERVLRPRVLLPVRLTAREGENGQTQNDLRRHLFSRLASPAAQKPVAARKYRPTAQLGSTDSQHSASPLRFPAHYCPAAIPSLLS